MDDLVSAPTSLRTALEDLAIIQALWLDDVEQTIAAADPCFVAVFRRWEYRLSELKVALHRAEQHVRPLLAAVRAVGPVGPTPVVDRAACFRRWNRALVAYTHGLRLPTVYRRLADIMALEQEATTADVVTDLVAVAVLAETTGQVLRGGSDDTVVVDEVTLFHQVLSPWRQEGLPALFDVLRWLHALLAAEDEIF